MNFTEKNNNRRSAFRAARDSNRSEALFARDLRRSVGGAFGNTDPKVHNVLVFGTTGTEKAAGEKA